MFGLKRKKRQRLRDQPFPKEWEEILKRHVSYYHRLSPADKNELQGHIQVFLNEKTFEGCGGLEINDEIRIVIAAQACILLLHRETDYYPTLQTILVYPHPYRARVKTRMPDGVVMERDQVRLGESWIRGSVILSWDEVNRTAHDHDDAHNVVFHEFAHQLDSESGDNEGVPLLPRRSAYRAWVRVLGNEFHHLIHDLEEHRPTDLDGYGATNPAEFFAVVTEEFFENPVRLRKHHPQLYAQLESFYHQNPVERFQQEKEKDH